MAPVAPMRGDHSLETAEPAEIDLREVELVEIEAFEHLVAEGHLGSERPAGGDGIGLVHRKFALGENVQHFPADIAGGADDCNLVAHLE